MSGRLHPFYYMKIYHKHEAAAASSHGFVASGGERKLLSVQDYNAKQQFCRLYPNGMCDKLNARLT